MLMIDCLEIEEKLNFKSDKIILSLIESLDLMPINKTALEIFSVITPFDSKILFELNRDDYDRITKENLKIHALIAELGSLGAGQTLVKFVMKMIHKNESLTQSDWHELYAILEYGKKYSELTLGEQNIACHGAIVKESAHFSEIMSIDQLGEDSSKKIVGQTNLVDKSLSRLLQNYEGRRKDRNYLTRLPVKYDAQPGGRCRFIQEQEVILTRHRYPNCAAMLVSEIRGELDKNKLKELYNLLEIEADKRKLFLSNILKKLVCNFEVLLCRYPVEQALAFFDKLIFGHIQLQQLQLSFLLAQPYKNSNKQSMLKIFVIGNGSALLLNKLDQRYIMKRKYTYVRNKIKLGNIYQPKFTCEHVLIDDDSVLLLLPPGYEKTEAWEQSFIENVVTENLRKGWQSVSNEFIRLSARFMRGKRSAVFPVEINQNEIDVFQREHWTSERVADLLHDFNHKIKEYAGNYQELRIGIQFSHIHSNRGIAFAHEQKRAAQITKIMHQELSKISNVKIRLEPLVDNHHVTDALNYQEFERNVSLEVGKNVTEILLEDSLPIGMLAIQVFRKLIQNKKAVIDKKGEKVFLHVPNGTLIQLFDDVTEHASATIGCVLFEAGLEIYRLNPQFINKLFFEWLEKKHQNSDLYQWHLQDEDLTYHELVIKNLYRCISNANEREKIKSELIYKLLPTYSEILENKDDTYFFDEIVRDYQFKKETKNEESILIHVLEGLLYGDQGKKFRSLCEIANLPIIVPRINFDDDSGVVIFDLPNNF